MSVSSAESAIKRYEPLWGTWYVESLLGAGSFGQVYRIRQKVYARTYYSAVKIISIPHDRTELQRMKIEGLDQTAMRRFYQALGRSIAKPGSVGPCGQ